MNIQVNLTLKHKATQDEEVEIMDKFSKQIKTENYSSAINK